MGDKKEILDLFQFQQSEIIAPGCFVLDANWANNVKGRESGMSGYGSRGKNQPIFRALINGSSLLLPLLPTFRSNSLPRLGETPKIDRKIYSNISFYFIGIPKP